MQGSIDRHEGRDDWVGAGGGIGVLKAGVDLSMGAIGAKGREGERSVEDSERTGAGGGGAKATLKTPQTASLAVCW